MSIDQGKLQTLEDWDKEKFLADVEDMYVRLSGVKGREVLHLILASVVGANPSDQLGKDSTRLHKIENLLFGSRFREGDILDDDEVLLWMYRVYLTERKNLSGGKGRKKTIEGGIAKIADAAVRRLRPDLIAHENQSKDDENEFDILSRRYKEAFSAQREEMRNRYSDILDFGQENKIVAAVLLKILAVTGLRVDLRPVELSLIAVSDEEQAEFEREANPKPGE